jgi:uncharacterized protein (TIGR00299 family) protein
MKILYYDCFAGISGDMNLGAMIDAGVPKDYLIREIKKLNVEGYQLEISTTLKMGISGTRANVKLTEKGHHKNGHSHSHSHGKHNEHRNLGNIKKIIIDSSLNSFVKEKSIAIFEEIARAEAKIHAKTVDEIHFHEVGAIDSIVDIVGASICIDYFKPEKILSSTPELGGGFVKCAHGTFPVPAPATAEILTGIPIKKGKVDKETTTPTGAAILKIFVDEFIDSTNFSIEKTAYGIGHHDLEIPNVLRVYIGETKKNEDAKEAHALLIECNIDDMNPEHYDYLMDKLFESGAQDVFFVPIIMKKSRPAVQVKVLCESSRKEALENILLTETTSLGLRYFPVHKSMLGRNIRSIDTQYGPIRIKEGILMGKTIKSKAEYDDCVKAAKKANVPLQTVYNEVEKCLNKEK